MFNFCEFLPTYIVLYWENRILSTKVGRKIVFSKIHRKNVKLQINAFKYSRYIKFMIFQKLLRCNNWILKGTVLLWKTRFNSFKFSEIMYRVNFLHDPVWNSQTTMLIGIQIMEDLLDPDPGGKNCRKYEGKKRWKLVSLSRHINPYGEVHVFRMSLWAEHLRHWEEIFR